MRKQVRASRKGLPYENDTIEFLAEYNRRKKLREIGFVDSIENLDALTGQMFIVIEDELASIREAEEKIRGGKK